MNKAELVAAVAKKADVSKTQAEDIINHIFAVITAKLSEDVKIQLADFGTFETKTRAERKGRNPQSGGELTIPAFKTVAFTPAKTVKNIINQKTFIEDFLTAGKITDIEANLLAYVVEMSKGHVGDLAMIEVKDIASHLRIDEQEAEKLADTLIHKKILNTMVYYGPTDSVYLRARWRKYV